MTTAINRFLAVTMLLALIGIGTFQWLLKTKAHQRSDCWFYSHTFSYNGTMAKDGLFYHDEDFSRGNGVGSLIGGSLPDPTDQDKPELLEKAKEIYKEACHESNGKPLPNKPDGV